MYQNEYTAEGVHTHMAGAIVQNCIWMTFLCIPGLNILALFNAFPTIALIFAIISAATSKLPAKREMSLRFAARAKTMNLVSLIVNAVSLGLALLFVLVAAA